LYERRFRALQIVVIKIFTDFQCAASGVISRTRFDPDEEDIQLNAATAIIPIIIMTSPLISIGTRLLPA
jgi:hypothetical protein